MNQPKYGTRLYRRIGKAVFGLLLMNGLQLPANAQLVNLSVSNQPLTKVCKEIEKQTGYYFIYANDLKDKSYPVSVNIKNQPVKEALAKVFQGSPYAYEVNDKLVSVNTARPTTKNNKAETAEPTDTLTVTGQIFDGKGRGPLENASVTTSITKRSAMTDPMGRFKLKGVKQGELIQVTYIGYQQNKTLITDQREYFMSLTPATNELDNVVVKAYGKTTQRYNTGSIVTISGKEIENQPTMNPLLALQGRVPGLVITPTDGNPAAPVKIEIRGRNTLNPNMTGEPLYVIDGIPYNVTNAGPQAPRQDMSIVSSGLDQAGITAGFTNGISPLYGMNVNDIASISVLKDADATAIYGSRGANGVIIIKTKRGEGGRPQINVNLSRGQKSITRHYDFLKTQDYLALRREAFANDGITPSNILTDIGFAPDLTLWDTTRYVDWQKELWGHSAAATSANASISGGSGTTNYRLSGGYNRQNDIAGRNSSNQSGNVSISLDNSFFMNKLKISFEGTLTGTSLDKTGMYPSSLVTLPPNAPSLINPDGTGNFAAYRAAGYKIPPFTSFFNTLSSKGNSVRGSATITYNIASGLNFTGRVGMTKDINNSISKIPIKGQDPFAAPNTPVTGKTNFGYSRLNSMIIEPQLSYSKNIKNNPIQAIVGFTYQTNKTASTNVNADGYTSDDFMGSMAYATNVKAKDYFAEYKYAGIFGGLTYTVNDRYVVSLNGRRDGSSRFGPGKEYGNFGSVGASWLASEEAFAKKILPAFVSFLKFQGSFGLTGDDAVGEYQYLPQWGNELDLPDYNGVTSVYPLLMANSDYHWQSTKKFQVSAELGLFEDRINLNGAYYLNRCDNQLISFPTGSFTGYTSYTANSPANVQNSGWEISASGQVVKTKDFRWNLSVNISRNSNKLISYPFFEYSPFYGIYAIGQSLSAQFKYKYLGIDPQTGKPRYEDHNKDGKIDYDYTKPAGTGKDDRISIVDATPKLSGGLTTSFSYKNWSLYTTFSYKRYNQMNNLTDNLGAMRNYSYTQLEGHWRYPGQDATAPRATVLPLPDSHFADSDALYDMINVFRLTNASVGWTAPNSWASAVKMQRLNISINADNLLLITNYKGIDPDLNVRNGGNPPTRTVTVTLGATF
ncbi:TonB-linked outer membrane protein, SusC/RagA family [Chitinophaga terrae (ex Kim and Jung 2007)]|uniref:TonB-linked outer membrane protein, SusC/RagA family n=1 Tax=Chitinophaga terrae (ex Kim and Jung 2007) TaxID=408074 RepID=A0A1H4BR07_9BACT|nr:SusC/RagA family TonB-linked outer membrane protein [Chitinophaga terrae (ex Kim and Jung 2007)]SEA50539.1 TonB-linked outer membrane protein, SusC/RagA family [Chitinophaga terrae (ex Kim and Jung 2007)]